MRDYKAKHSTLLEACSNNGNHQNSQEASDTESGSGHSQDYEDSFWDKESGNQSSCSPCNEYGVLLRHLCTCPEPQLDLPQEISDLSIHY